MLVQRQLRYQPFQLAVLFLQFLHPLCLVHLQTAVFLPPAVERLDGDLGFLAGLWGGLSVRDAYFNLPQHRYDLLWLVPLDWHDQLFLQVDSLSFHLVQILPVTSPPAHALPTEFELQVRQMQLTARTYTSSLELRAWCEQNRNRLYVPEWLLEEWGITVDPTFSAAA